METTTLEGDQKCRCPTPITALMLNERNQERSSLDRTQHLKPSPFQNGRKVYSELVTDIE